MKRTRAGSVLAAAFVLLLAAGGVFVLLSNPRHRAFYFGGGGASTAAPEGRAAPRSRRSFGAGAATPTVSTGAAVHPARRVPLPDAAGRIRVPVTDRAPSRLPAEGVPTGWELHEWAGRAAIELIAAEQGIAVRLRSARASFALHRDVIVDLKEFPFLAWQWKAARLPAGGDVRARASDDQAAQVYVVFPRWPSPLTSSEVIGYVWDSRAPVGTQVASPKAPNVRIIVVESGTSRLDSWQRQERNVAADYAALFGRQPPRVGQIALMIDSNDTRSDAEVLFGELAFSRIQERTETPTSMLR